MMNASVQVRELGRGGDIPLPFQIESYDHLLEFPQLGASTSGTPSGMRAITEPLVDAIVVPTFRSAEQLHAAAQLAADARCHLIVIYTDRLPAGIAGVLDGFRPGQVTLLAVRSGGRDRLLDPGGSLPQSRVSVAALDISRKRNLGLLIARVCGWTRLIFLDDDIRKLGVAKLSSAAVLLDDYPVVGLQVRRFPDASVVGHARRLAGHRQEPFVSGGSLLVNPQLLDGYFAPVYHEDWLCIINHLRKGEVAIGGSVGQLMYRPFTTPERAKFEEFGDILLSGLLWLVHSRASHGAAPEGRHAAERDYWREATNPGFWTQVLEQRAVLLADLTAYHTGADLDGPSPLPSLAAATQCLSELSPAEFVSFTEAWLSSLDQWRDWQSALARVESLDKAQAIDEALAGLGLAGFVSGSSPGLGARRRRAW